MNADQKSLVDALARHFQVVRVDEQTEEQVAALVHDLAKALEAHHDVRVLDEAVAEAIRLSSRYISGDALPETIVSVLDTACAWVAIGQNAIPPAIEDSERRIARLTNEIAALEREIRTGAYRAERIEARTVERAIEELQLATLRDQWEQERELIARIREIWARLEVGDPEALRTELARREAELAELQGEAPLMQACVNAHGIAEVVSAWTGIPVAEMLTAK